MVWGASKARLWESGAITEIPGFDLADFSDFGAVGRTPAGPALWKDGQILLLKDLIVTPGVTLAQPEAISNNGHIVLYFPAIRQAQLLKPVP